MKKILVITALVAAATLGTAGSAPPASAAVPGMPAPFEPVVCSMQLHYQTSGSIEFTSGSGTCTGLLGLRTYQVSVAPFAAIGNCADSPPSMSVLMELRNGSSVGHVTVNWGYRLEGLLPVLPLQAGLLNAIDSANPIGGLGIGVGAGPSSCVDGAGSTSSNATFVFLAPDIQY
jgi:hypothetical protein